MTPILRYILYDSGEKVVGLKKELEYVENYLELEEIRHGNRLQTKMEIIGETSGREIAPMIFLPFIENSFKHGVNANIGNSFVNIHFDINDTGLTFKIENNKPPHKLSETLDYQGGIGINNVIKRLHLLYPGKHILKIDEEGETFLVKLIIEWK